MQGFKRRILNIDLPSDDADSGVIDVDLSSSKVVGSAVDGGSIQNKMYFLIIDCYFQPVSQSVNQSVSQ